MAGTIRVRADVGQDSAGLPGVQPQAAPPVVQIRGASKHYGQVRAVDGVDLEIGRGELCGLIGHNGAGKTTLFRMMLGLIPATAGEILIEGEPVRGRGFRAVRRKIGYLPENVVLYDNLTGLETLAFIARLKGAPREDCPAALARVGLEDAGGRRVREYSKGMRQRLGFAQALLGRPAILFLDEPTNGLDPEAIRGFYALLRELRATGVTILLTSHVLAEIQDRVDRLAIMANGRVQALGTVPALRAQLDLPVRLVIRTVPARMPAVHLALERLALVELRPDGEQLLVQCRREDRLAVLEAVAGLRRDLLDVEMHEPSLEDVFFGLAGGHRWS